MAISDRIVGNDLTVNGNLSIPNPTFKSYAFQTGPIGKHYVAGYYLAPAAETNLTQGNLTQTYGAANNAYAAHAFLVAKQAGSVDAGAVSIVVSGVSINDNGTKNDTDTETIVADITAMTTDAYYETSKKWLGQVTFTLTDLGGATTFDADFNYGFCKYEDFGNLDFTVEHFEAIGHADANESGLDFELLHHKATGWTYSAAGFVPGNSSIAKMSTDHGANVEFDDAEFFAYKRANLATAVSGSASEGVVVRITTAVNNSIENGTCHIGVTF